MKLDFRNHTHYLVDINHAALVKRYFIEKKDYYEGAYTDWTRTLGLSCPTRFMPHPYKECLIDEEHYINFLFLYPDCVNSTLVTTDFRSFARVDIYLAVLYFIISITYSAIMTYTIFSP